MPAIPLRLPPVFTLSVAHVPTTRRWATGVRSFESFQSVSATGWNGFKRNMYAIIDHAPGWLNKRLRKVRKARAHKYFLAVRLFGNGAFWAGKTNPDNPHVHIG